MIAAHELGLAEQLQLVRTVAAMKRPNPDLLVDNPLSKIPTLVLDDGQAIFDSLTICEFLDHKAGGGILFPPPGPDRWRVLTWHALGNGLLDVLILWRNEREKPAEQQTTPWLAAFEVKTSASLNTMDALADALVEAPFGVAHIAIGCCLSYIDFQFPAQQWRTGRPALAAWHVSFCQRPSAKATEIADG